MDVHSTKSESTSQVYSHPPASLIFGLYFETNNKKFGKLGSYETRLVPGADRADFFLDEVRELSRQTTEN